MRKGLYNMHRSQLVQIIDLYQNEVLPLYAKTPGYEHTFFESDIINRFKDFIESCPRCFETIYFEPGHFTGSALVVNPDITKTVLTLHTKLKKWLQLGGHADNHPLMHEVALREVHEESGLQNLLIPSLTGSVRHVPLPFDLDIHEIPPHKDKPAHFHFDVRYFVIAEEETLTISDESMDLNWFTFEQARELTDEGSMIRQFNKALLLKDIIKDRQQCH